MFINRKTRRLSKINQNKIFNQSEDLTDIYQHKQIEIISYPILEYLFGFSLLGFSIFLLYSAGGGVNGIKGFNERQWWQIIIALLPMLIGIGFILFCQIQSLSISRKNNWIMTTKTRFFCFLTEQIKKEFSDLIGISVVKSGTDMVNITMTNYHIVLSFKTCDELPVLRCISQGKILEYFQQIRRIFSEMEISQNRVIIQNLLN